MFSENSFHSAFINRTKSLKLVNLKFRRLLSSTSGRVNEYVNIPALGLRSAFWRQHLRNDRWQVYLRVRQDMQSFNIYPSPSTKRDPDPHFPIQYLQLSSAFSSTGVQSLDCNFCERYGHTF